jgi:hypothetical protein
MPACVRLDCRAEERVGEAGGGGGQRLRKARDQDAPLFGGPAADGGSELVGDFPPIPELEAPLDHAGR